MKKFKKYLPSKKFLIILGVSATLVTTVLLIFFISSKIQRYSNQNTKKTALNVGNQTVEDLMLKDSDGDGVSDWEEALWGTDPKNKMTFNGIPDATYIANKKKDLKIDQNVTAENLTETDKFARQFFSAYTSMKASGQVDSQTINNFGNALGQKIVNPSLVDRYSEKDIKIANIDDANSRVKYYFAVKKLFESHKSTGLGDELSIVSGGLNTYSATGKDSQSAELTTIANAYQDFAQKITEMPVPNSLAVYHLRIANSANNTGISVSNMAKIISDPIVGLSGVSQYQKYNDDLTSVV